MGAQRLLLAIAILAMLALMLLAPQMLRDHAEPDVQPIELRSPDEPASRERRPERRPRQRPTATPTPTATAAPPPPAPTPAPAPPPPAEEDDRDGEGELD
jgi:outer membrane biosynthesis protein TonB